MKTIVGIDNGLDGGLCAVRAGKVLKKTPMPTLLREGKREIDIALVWAWVSKLDAPVRLVIEEPLKHARSSQAVRSMALSFGQLLALCRLEDCDHRIVQVNEWQRKVLGRVARGGTKATALAVAKKLQPGESWVANSRCRAPHDGIVDAYLLAYYDSTCPEHDHKQARHR